MEGAKKGPVFPLELKHLKLFRLGETELNARRCSFDEFVSFARSFIRVDDPEDLRTVFDRRDFLNWCAEQGLLEIQDDRLIPVKKAQTREIAGSVLQGGDTGA